MLNNVQRAHITTFEYIYIFCANRAEMKPHTLFLFISFRFFLFSLNAVGRKATARHSVATSRGGTPTEVDTRKSENERDEQSVMSEHQGREHKTNTDDDDSSMDSCSQNSLLFHNYSKRCNDEQKADDIDTTRVW